MTELTSSDLIQNKIKCNFVRPIVFLVSIFPRQMPCISQRCKSLHFRAMQRFTYDVTGQWPDLTWKWDKCQRYGSAMWNMIYPSVANVSWSVVKNRQGVAPNLPRQVNVNPCPWAAFYSVERKGGGRRIPTIRPMMEFDLREKNSVLLSTKGSQWYPIVSG